MVRLLFILMLVIGGATMCSVVLGLVRIAPKHVISYDVLLFNCGWDRYIKGRELVLSLTLQLALHKLFILFDLYTKSTDR